MTLPRTLNQAVAEQPAKERHDPSSKTARVLRMLKTQGEATNHELNKICFRFSPRLMELRDEGHLIVSERVKGGLWRYTYLGHDDKKASKAECKGCGQTYYLARYAKPGYCSHKCYMKHLPTRGAFTPVVPRIMAAVEKTSSGCWRSKLSHDQNGYSKVRYRGKWSHAHRVMYEEAVGPIPLGLEIDHLCRVRDCVNPLHLEAVTRQENMRRAGGTAKAIAALKSKTECKYGHAYTPENTYRNPTTNTRACKRCALERNRLARARRREVQS